MISHPRTEELAESVRLWIDEIRPTLDPRNAFLARVAANAMARTSVAVVLMPLLPLAVMSVDGDAGWNAADAGEVPARLAKPRRTA